MLVAYGPDGLPVIAEETSFAQLQQWSHERALYCPNCRGIVHVRGGPDKRTQLHFAHQRGECAWSTEGESVRHARGKLVLAHWLRQQFPLATVTLEERLPEPNRIADLFVVHPSGERWAVEFQCAPLDVDEWRHRHTAYQHAHIRDIWIVGNNRREKQEAFIEAILATAHEILFLDPLVTPPRTWLRWPLSSESISSWQRSKGQRGELSFEGWVGRLGYGVSLSDQLYAIRLDMHGVLIHPTRSILLSRTQFLTAMCTAPAVDESSLCTYLRQQISEEALSVVILPLLRAYLRDPDLLRRYNYGRGQGDHPPTTEDQQRIQRARQWLVQVAQRGFTSSHLQELAKEIPFVGPYRAFASYIEMLAALT